MISFFKFLVVGWDWVHFVRRPLIGLLYQPRMTDDECGTVGGMRIGRGNRSTRRKSAPVPLSPPQIPHDLTWARIRAAAVGSQRLTASATARPKWSMIRKQLRFTSGRYTSVHSVQCKGHRLIQFSKGVPKSRQMHMLTLFLTCGLFSVAPQEFHKATFGVLTSIGEILSSKQSLFELMVRYIELLISLITICWLKQVL
jgi:hypothetical protein